MNKNLDFLRAFAVSLVVLNHLIEFFGGPASIGPMDINCIGRMGVLLFFVHTSLVLMQSLERDPIRSKFYMRRAFRIYPLAMATIATAVVFNIPGAHLQTHQFLNYPADKMDIFANMLLVQDFSTRITLVSPSWTLLNELLYVSVPTILVLVCIYKEQGYYLLVMCYRFIYWSTFNKYCEYHSSSSYVSVFPSLLYARCIGLPTTEGQTVQATSLVLAFSCYHCVLHVHNDVHADYAVIHSVHWLAC